MIHVTPFFNIQTFEPRKSIYYKAHITASHQGPTKGDAVTATVCAHTTKGLAEAINRHMGLDMYGSGIVTSSIVRNTIYYPDRVSPKWDFLEVERVDQRVLGTGVTTSKGTGVTTSKGKGTGVTKCDDTITQHKKCDVQGTTNGDDAQQNESERKSKEAGDDSRPAEIQEDAEEKS